MAALVECTATASNSTATIVSRDDGTGSTMGGDLEKQPRDAQAVPAGKETDGEVIWVDWDGPDDPENPFNWSKRRRWIISSVGIMFCALVSLSVSGYSIALESVVTLLDTNKTLAALGITTFTIAFGASPLILAPISEAYGRSRIYLVSAVVFTVFFIPQALAKNIETVLVTRFISGVAGSSAVSLVGGTLSDVWSNHERGLPMGIFALSAFASTGLGPVIFGYVEERHDFRLVNWIMFAASGAFSAALFFVLSETRGPVLLSRKAARLRKETGDERYQCKADLARSSFKVMIRTSLNRPLKMLFTEPVLISFTAWISFVWAVLYIYLISIVLVFRNVYQFSIGECGLIYNTQILGSFLGLFIDHWCNKLYLKNVAKRGPEARLYNGMLAGLFIPAGSLLFSLTAQVDIHWIVPCIGATILYCGMFLIYLSCFSYLADAYTLYASSALSAMSLSRNLIGSVFPLFTTQLYSQLGVKGAGGLTAGLGAALAVTPFVLFRYGARLRARSPFALELARLREAGEIH